jgi:acetylglutamate kinase
VFLTDVPGVWNASAKSSGVFGGRDATLAEGAVIRGGMLPKLEACRQALAGGIGRVQIVPAKSVKTLLKLEETRSRVGTEVVAA